MFASFAFAYFLSALLRAVTATLAPSFSAELGLGAAELGLLAGAYFLGFATTQLPLGSALDRLGPRRVLLALLALAVAGCAAFALARSFVALTLARALIGVGVSACLMAPLTAFRRRFSPVAQMRSNSWMLMSGSLGMIASTLPVQWLLPLLGWRGLFRCLALALVVAMVAIAALVPADGAPVEPAPGAAREGYAAVFRHPTFLRFAPMGFFHYGGLIAVQSLWAGPWLVKVCGWSPAQAASGLFGINVAMLVAFMAWGWLVPRLHASGWTAQRLIARGTPVSLVVLALAVVTGPGATAWAWAAFCVSCTVVSLSQPAVGMALPPSLAGRALSAYNLLIFGGIFTLQWGMGVVIDVFTRAGADDVSAYRGAFGLLGLSALASYAWFLWRADGPPPEPAA